MRNTTTRIEGAFADERWLPIEGTKNLLISDYGRVYSIRTKKFVGCKGNQDGYKMVRTSPDGNAGTRAYIHRLVYLHFVIPTIPEGCEIEHLDSDNSNDYFMNLRAVPHKTNCNNPITRKRISDGLKAYYQRKREEEAA